MNADKAWKKRFWFCWGLEQPALFLCQSILSWNHGIPEREWRWRWWQIRILGSRLLIAQSPHLSLSSSQPAVKLLLLLNIQKLSCRVAKFFHSRVGSDTSQIFVFRRLPDFFVLLSEICEKVRETWELGDGYYWSQIVCFIKLLFDVTLVYSWSPTANLTSEAFLNLICAQNTSSFGLNWQHLRLNLILQHLSCKKRMIFWTFCTFLQLLAINSIWSTGVEVGGHTWLMGGTWIA